jgi:HD-GYP domain-containing protein (c-di-GMP phosphodiesterase class II)
MAATSLAADTGMAMPLETGLATCLVAVRLARAMQLTDQQTQRIYHLALLEHIGCTAATREVSDVVGDELLMREYAALLDFSDRRERFSFMLAHVTRANPVLARPMALARAMVGGRRITDSAKDVCEAGQVLAERIGYAKEDIDDLAIVYEHWDGSGFPNALQGNEIPIPVQVVQVAALAVNAVRQLGRQAGLALVKGRAGNALAPQPTAALLANRDDVLAPLEATGSLWDDALAAEPIPSPAPTDEEVDRALAALGDLADLKSPHHTGHSQGVGDLAAVAAAIIGLDHDTQRLVRRAGYVHDLGRIAVSSSVWCATRPLRPDEWERVRMHPYHTHQVLDRSPFLRSLDAVATDHHERLDGSGYYRGLPATALTASSRLLAAADSYETKIEPRPHRAAMSPDQAADHLRAEARAGRLDPESTDAVLQAAGQPRTSSITPRLTGREREILGQVALGSSMREIARALGISPKTVDGHLQRIYPKIGVQTRSGAALYAVEHGLLPHVARTAGTGGEGEISP